MSLLTSTEFHQCKNYKLQEILEGSSFLGTSQLAHWTTELPVIFICQPLVTGS